MDVYRHHGINDPNILLNKNEPKSSFPTVGFVACKTSFKKKKNPTSLLKKMRSRTCFFETAAYPNKPEERDRQGKDGLIEARRSIPFCFAFSSKHNLHGARI